MKRIPLGSKKYSGLFAVVDDESFEALSGFKWRAVKARHTFYAARDVRRSDGTKAVEFMHQRVIGVKAGFFVDHKDRDGLNNTRGNLRHCSRAENMQNRRTRVDSTTNLKGVTPFAGKFQSRISVKGKRLFLGCFDTAEQAHEAYKAASNKFHGAFGRAA